VGTEAEQLDRLRVLVIRSRPERADDSLLDDPEVDQQATRRLGVHSALYVPLLVRGRPIGIVNVAEVPSS